MLLSLFATMFFIKVKFMVKAILASLSIQRHEGLINFSAIGSIEVDIVRKANKHKRQISQQHPLV